MPMYVMIEKNKTEAYKRAYVMGDSALLAANVKTSLHELAKQAFMLANGLQNAAPEGSANQSISYLFAISQYLYQKSAELEI